MLEREVILQNTDKRKNGLSQAEDLALKSAPGTDCGERGSSVKPGGYYPSAVLPAYGRRLRAERTDIKMHTDITKRRKGFFKK